MSKKTECDERKNSITVKLAPLSLQVFSYTKPETGAASNKSAKAKTAAKAAAEKKTGKKGKPAGKTEEAVKAVKAKKTTKTAQKAEKKDKFSPNTPLFEELTDVKKKTDKFNLYLNMQGSFDAHFRDGFQEGDFNMHQLRIEAKGNINNWLSYRYRQRLNLSLIHI